MKLYAIRDRLLEYFQRPFIGDTDATVLAAVATAINTEANVDFAKTPTHFEVWTLATINEETGTVTGAPKFIANCSDLRRGHGEDRIHRVTADASTAPQGGARPKGSPGQPGTLNRAPEDATQSQTGTSGEGGQGSQGLHPTP